MSRPKLHDSPAARVAAFRAKNQLVTLSVDLPVDLVSQLETYMAFKSITKKEVIETLIRTQLLRKR